MPKKSKGLKTTTKHGGRKRASGKNINSFEQRILAAVGVVDVADSLTAPLTRSIENLLRQAAASVGTDEASVLVRDGNKGGLRFLVAVGDVADMLMKVKIPPGRGIAGFVFSSGQPMAVANASQEEAFYPEVDRKTGYSTQTLLATPLRVDGEVVGVMEFVNRVGVPPFDAFTPDEMDRVAHFAEAIATLVEARESAALIESLFERIITSEDSKVRGQAADVDALRKWLKTVRAAPEHRDMLELAVSLREIASRGDNERALCRQILAALSEYTRRSTSSVLSSYLGI